MSGIEPYLSDDVLNERYNELVDPAWVSREPVSDGQEFVIKITHLGVNINLSTWAEAELLIRDMGVENFSQLVHVLIRDKCRALGIKVMDTRFSVSSVNG